MYAHMLHTVPDVLLYADPEVWVERNIFLYPPGELRVGFRFSK
jgi:hypothetical protein